MWKFHVASWLLSMLLLQVVYSQEAGETSYSNLALGVDDDTDVSDNVAAMASAPDALNAYIRQIALANNVDDEDLDGQYVYQPYFGLLFVFKDAITVNYSLNLR